MNEPALNPASSVALQIPCTALAAAPAAAVIPLFTGTLSEETIARRKADFVAAVWSLSDEMSAQEACQTAAAGIDHSPELMHAGKNGASLLGKSAYANYRQWVQKLGRASGTPKPDVENWRALLPRYRGSRGYARPGDDRFWVAMAKVYEHPNKFPMRSAYDHCRREILAREPQFSFPTFAQVRHYYERHADQKAVFIAREGEEAFRNQVAGFITREAPDPDSAWVGDHHKFDAAVKVWDGKNGLWAPVRPWITAWEDWGSNYFVGFVIRAIDPNRDSIERALRSALEKNSGRPPVHIVIDNGKDYSAAGLFEPILKNETDMQRISSIGQALGAKVHFCIPYNARSKPIERQFRIVCERFSKLWASYRGSKPADRPESADAAWGDPEKLPTLEEFTRSFERWLALDHHSTPSNARHMEGQTPLQVRSAMTSPRLRLEAGQIYKAFLRELPKERKIERGGIVRALSREYRSEALWRLLGQVDSVRVKVDVDDISHVWIYTLDGREIGEATSKSILPAFAETPEAIEQFREEQKRHARQIKETKAASAARRDMGRWLNAPPAAIEISGQRSGVRKRIPSSGPSAPCPMPSALCSDADVRELDAMLRERSAAAIESQKAEDDCLDQSDMVLLSEIEKEREALL